MYVDLLDRLDADPMGHTIITALSEQYGGAHPSLHLVVNDEQSFANFFQIGNPATGKPPLLNLIVNEGETGRFDAENAQEKAKYQREIDELQRQQQQLMEDRGGVRAEHRRLNARQEDPSVAAEIRVMTGRDDLESAYMHAVSLRGGLAPGPLTQAGFRAMEAAVETVGADIHYDTIDYRIPANEAALQANQKIEGPYARDARLRMEAIVAARPFPLETTPHPGLDGVRIQGRLDQIGEEMQSHQFSPPATPAAPASGPARRKP